MFQLRVLGLAVKHGLYNFLIVALGGMCIVQCTLYSTQNGNVMQNLKIKTQPIITKGIVCTFLR